MVQRKPILCMDFDGVIHSYKSGWKGESIIDDPPVEGSLEFLYNALHYFRVAVFSSRSTSSGINAMQLWLDRWCRERWPEKSWMGDKWWLQIEWPMHKPSAFLTIDDRAITFAGQFPPMQELLDFKTWIEKAKADAR